MDADVVVIGAGAAGLAAARSLGRRKLRVLLLEARDRVGGRVLSHAIAGIATPAELGAEFIHGPAEQTKALLREAGSAAIDMGGDAWIRENGELRCEQESFSSSARIFEGSRSLPDDESVEHFLRRFENDRALCETAQAARAFVEGFEAADPAIASAKAIADEIESGTDSTSARPLGGYGPMVEQLRSDCERAGVRFALSTCVRRISWSRDDVVVEAANSRGESQALQARAAIVTLAVGVLRHRGDETEIGFVPELPATKREALAHIEMGHVVKVALAFRTAFWERVAGGRYHDAAFFHIDGQPIPTFWTQLPVRSELIVAWVGGPGAVALSGVSESDLVEKALHGFGELFDETELARREFEGGLTHDWSGDPFARGAYSYVAVGGGNARAVLAAPVDDSLFFAGEATSSDGQGGTVNGAIETGERAAAQAAAALGVKEIG
ncbi:MAG: flavin monoamine oxidase family protein [Candidatus Cybelea sp.]|jgi:monoamine oxidase